MVRVAVYSDQPVLAKGLESLIAADPALESSASCSKVAVLKKHLANENPDLAVLDLTPEITSAALNELQNLAPESKLILWTNTLAGDLSSQAVALAAGAAMFTESLFRRPVVRKEPDGSSSPRPARVAHAAGEPVGVHV